MCGIDNFELAFEGSNRFGKNLHQTPHFPD